MSRAKVGGANHRTKKMGLISDLRYREWKKIVSSFDGKCAYCGADYEILEHVIPVSKGGGTTRDNVVPSCRACNNKKGSKDVMDFVNGGR